MTPRGASAPSIVLGTMNFGGRTPDAEARRILSRAVERGVTHIDTANAYTEGQSERLVGEALRVHPQLQVATKLGLGRLRGPPEGLSPAVMRGALQLSLGRLGTDRVPLLYLHMPDPKTPLQATLETLAEMKAAGLFGDWALSNYSAWQSVMVIQAADTLGLARPVAGQMLYNALVRDLNHEYLSFAQAFGLATVVYNPLAGGLLTGQHQRGAPPPSSRFGKNPVYQRRYWSDRLFDVVEDLRALAAESQLSLTALAYRWLSGAPGVDAIVLGPSALPHLDEALDALESGALPQDLHKAVDGVYRAYRGTDAVYAR